LASNFQINETSNVFRFFSVASAEENLSQRGSQSLLTLMMVCGLALNSIHHAGGAS